MMTLPVATRIFSLASLPVSWCVLAGWVFVAGAQYMGTPSSLSATLNLITEFVTVDYLWNANHTRFNYEYTGQFQVSNNIITGIKVSKAGQIFVSVPRWFPGVPSSLNVLVQNPNGPGFVLDPWPSWEFNAYNSTTAAGATANGKYPSLQYAQSFIIDSQNIMWIPDVGRANIFSPAKYVINEPGPALFRVDVASGKVLSYYRFPEYVLSRNNSFVNDIVLDEVNGYAYFTDTFAKGGIVVYNVAKNTSHSFSGPPTRNNASYNFCVDGYCYGKNDITSPSDGIALSSDGRTLYWSPVQGQGLYSVSTSIIQDFSNSNAVFSSNLVVFLGYKTGCSDGLLFLNGNLYYGNIQNSQLGAINNIQSYTTPNSVNYGASSVTISSPFTLNWIDTFSVDFNNPNAFYFTSNRLNLFFNNMMDFTGNSGANMRIFHAIISGTPTAAPVTTSSTKASNLSNGGIAAIAGSCFLVFLFGIVVLLRRRILSNTPPASLPNNAAIMQQPRSVEDNSMPMARTFAVAI